MNAYQPPSSAFMISIIGNQQQKPNSSAGFTQTKIFIMFSRIKGMHSMRENWFFAANSSSSIGNVIFLPHALSLYVNRIVMFPLMFPYAVIGSDRATVASML